jgi:hypothetical protein
MTKGTIAALLMVMIASVPGSFMANDVNASTGHEPTYFAKHFEGSTLQFTENRMFGVEMVIPEKTYYRDQ